MDHLPTPSCPTQTLPRVPYLDDPQYRYHAPFTGLREQLSTILKGTTEAECSALIQQWLFFGLLKEYFAIWNLPLQEEDFITRDGSSFWLTTRNLCEYLIAAQATELQVFRQKVDDKKLTGIPEEDAETSPAQHRVTRLAELLWNTHSFIRDLEIHQHSLPVMPAVWDCILLLAATLCRASENVYKPNRDSMAMTFWPTEHFGDFRLKSINDVRDNPKWCSPERRVITDLVSGRLPELAFFSQLDRQEAEHISHAKCEESTACMAYQIADGTKYKTRHVSEECECNFRDLNAYGELEEKTNRFSTSAARFARILPKAATKEIEAVTFVNGQLKRVSISVAEIATSSALHLPMKGAALVAISHVWADGLGNREENALPECQLRRLQEAANDLYPEKQRPVAFWIDTLMIPVRSSTAEEKDLKIEALRDMEWVYKSAQSILVLDHTLLSTPVSNFSEEEIGARIMCSVWSRRLWTLQEGCSPDHTYFKFADKVVRWPELHKAVQQRANLSSWQKNSTLGKDHVIRKSQQLDWYRSQMGLASAGPHGRSRSIWSAWPKFAAISMDEWMYQTLYPVWHGILMFLEDLTIQWSGSGLRGEALGPCIRGMFYRNCSKPEDESLVLASMLSRSPGAPARYTEAVKEKSDRYLCLFRDLKKVPSEILFIDHLRYQEKGCGWIPKSLLKVNSASAVPMLRKDKIWDQPRHAIAMYRKYSPFCVHNEDGLVVGLTGLRLPRVLVAPFAFRAYDEYWKADVRVAGTTQPLTDFDLADWVLIPEGIIAYKPPRCRAVLVKVEQWEHDRRGGKTKFMGLVQLSRILDGESDLPVMEVDYPVPKVDLRALQTMPKEELTELVSSNMNAQKVIWNIVRDDFVHNDKWVVG